MHGERLEGLAQDDQANPFRLPIAELAGEMLTEVEFRRRRPNTFTLDIGEPEREP